MEKNTYRAEFAASYSYLNTEFGLNLACKRLKKTPEEVEALVGRYTKGKRKGQLRGMLHWFKCTRGGWVRMGFYDHDARQGNGFVFPLKGSTFGYHITDAWDTSKVLDEGDAWFSSHGYVDSHVTAQAYMREWDERKQKEKEKVNG